MSWSETHFIESSHISAASASLQLVPINWPVSEAGNTIINLSFNLRWNLSTSWWYRTCPTSQCKFISSLLVAMSWWWAVTHFPLRGTNIQDFPGKAAEQKYCFAGSTDSGQLKSYQVIAGKPGAHYNWQHQELRAISSEPAEKDTEQHHSARVMPAKASLVLQQQQSGPTENMNGLCIHISE